MSNSDRRPNVCIIGGGFTGLAAAYDLVRRGAAVTILEADAEVGGLAGSFDVDGHRLEKFYHHWFTNDLHVTGLIRELGAEAQILHRPTRTGMYYANQFFRLSSPLDVLRFTPLRLIDRVRLGRLVLRARKVRDWRALESLTAEEWLLKLAGPEVYRVVWEPLMRGKFGPYAPHISAVWMWNKLKLRGGSRGKGAGEVLAYFRGGFDALARLLADRIRAGGGDIRTNSPATGLRVEAGRATAVDTAAGPVAADVVLLTPALPIVARLVEPHVPADYVARLNGIEYLANLCLVLELDRSLSDTYWLNVNDPQFPFVGVIEHTNFEPPASYGGRHIVYLSKYLPESHEMWRMPDGDLLEFALPHLKRMFPAFDRAWVVRHHVWRARYAQPIVGRHYGALIPPRRTPIPNVYLSTMAQVYPEDRGTNYAIREGREVAAMIADAHPVGAAGPTAGLAAPTAGA